MDWHSITLEKTFSKTKGKKEGLTSAEVKNRLKEFGPNVLPEEKPYSKTRLFLRQLNSILVYIVLVAAFISFWMGHYSDGIFMIIVIVLNTTVGFYQEIKANQSLRALKKIARIRAKVMRDGYEKEVDSEELTVGDIVFLAAGDKAPADGRIIEARNLKVNEAVLTGESRAAEKEPGKLSEGALLPERKNMVFTGTIVEEGQAKIIVVEVGINTELGKIVSLLRATKERKTSLQKKIAVLSMWVGFFIVAAVTIIVIEGYFSGKNFAEISVAALALAVSAIPEGLLPAITVIMVLGMRRIFTQRGLVRKLSATETLGSVTVICSDKTGTLTQGKMEVSHILTSTKELIGEDFSNVAAKKDVNGAESHISVLKIAAVASGAFVENPDDELKKWVIRGKPTDKALLLASIYAGIDRREVEKQNPVIERMPFESSRKFSSFLCKKNKAKNILNIVGAPEEILSRCSHIDFDGRKKRISKKQSERLIEKLEQLTGRGLRVIAFAHKNCDFRASYKNLGDIAENLSFVGFIALKDPLRHDAKESILITKKAGIKTIIVTGDHRLTARAIAKEVGIEAGDKNILEGKDLELMSDEELKKKAGKISIYARVSPRHKLRIIDALQDNGEIVAMFGDGVNDAPAMKSADIGVAVGSGTDVAKEVADVILLDDNFRTVVKAVEQGRVIFGNIRKIFVYLIADDFSQLSLFFVSLAFGFPVPLLAPQILWINLIEDGLPAVAVTTEQETKGIMAEKPRNPKEPILNKPLRLWMLAIFFITSLAAIALFFSLSMVTGDLDEIRTTVFALMCFDSLIFTFSVRSFKKSAFRKDVFSNKYITGAVAASMILLALAIYFPPLQKILHTQSLSIAHWIVVLGIGFLEIIIIEFFKEKIFTEPIKGAAKG